MPCLMRWSVSLLVCALLGASAPMQSQGVGLGLILNSPRQLVEVPDEDGTMRLAEFEANARVYENGRVAGGAVLDLGKERYEIRFQKALEIVTEGQVVRAVSFDLVIESSAKKPKVVLVDQGFGFIRDESGIEHSFKLVYDIRGSFLYDKPPFEAEGTLRLTREARGTELEDLVGQPR